MDETRNERPRNQSGEPRQASGDSVGSQGRQNQSRKGQNRKSSADLEREIGHTRADMDETVDEIQRRLSPGHMKRQAQGAVRDTAKGAGNQMLDTIKQNPIPSILAGLSVGWLVAKGSSSSDGKAHRMQGQASEAAGRAGDKAKQYGHQAQHRAQQAQHQAQQAAGRAQRMMQENPMAAGAAAVATGAFVGFLVPETRKENELMGPARDSAMDKAQSKASDALHRAEQVAERTAEEAKASAKKVKETAKEEAKKQKKESKEQS